MIIKKKYLSIQILLLEFDEHAIEKKILQFRERKYGSEHYHYLNGGICNFMIQKYLKIIQSYLYF